MESQPYFWDKYLRNPPPEVSFSADWHTKPEDYHCVRWVGFEEGLEIDELWQFGSEMRGTGKWLPEMDFTKYGGETLCGIKIESGQKVYGPRWRSIEPISYRSEPPDENNLHPVLIDLYGITCMVCRNRLMYGVSRLIEDLTFIRSKLVGDWLGEEYISREPLVHGKQVLSHEEHCGRISETYRLNCQLGAKEMNPRLVDGKEEFDLITCPDCIVTFETDLGDD